MAEFIHAYWMQAIWTILLAVATYLIKKISKGFTEMKCEQDAMKEGILSIGHDRLYQATSYFLSRHKKTGKGILINEMKNLEYLYNGYAGLGGNGTCKELYERCTELPIEESEEES